jgi:hypothetical protein
MMNIKTFLVKKDYNTLLHEYVYGIKEYCDVNRSYPIRYSLDCNVRRIRHSAYIR